MHLKPIRPYRYFPFDRYQCELWRLEDEAYKTLSERSFEIRVSPWTNEPPERLSLTRALVALETLFGKSSAPYEACCGDGEGKPPCYPMASALIRN